jgi:hypothetical protein
MFAVAERQCSCAGTEKFQIGRDDFGIAQKLGQRQHDVSRGDARLRLAGKFDADDVGQAHPRGAAQHHALGFQPADTDGEHAKRVDHRRVRVGADQRVRIGHAALCLNHGRHALEIDLVQDAVPGRDHVDVLEGLLGPVNEVEAVFVAAVFNGAVLGERIRVEPAAFDRQRMVDHELRRHHRIDQRRVAPLQRDGVAQAGQIDQRGLAEDVVADHARREPRKVQVALAFDELS